MQNKFEYTWNNWQRRITADKRLRTFAQISAMPKLRIRWDRYTQLVAIKFKFELRSQPEVEAAFVVMKQDCRGHPKFQ